MSRLIVSRLVQLPLLLAVIFAVTLTLAWLLPGSPLEKVEGRRTAPEILEAMERQYNLDNPFRFAGSYLTNVFTGADFGPSLEYQDQRVSAILAQGLPVSVQLGCLALVVGLVLGTAAGVLGALKPGTAWDTGSLAVALIGVSLPNFVTGSILLLVFAGLIPLLPVGGWGTPAHLVLPAITLGIAPAAYIARLTRLGLADILSSDFVRTARAKGLSERDAILKHAMKVAFLPVLSFLGPAAAAVMTGSFVVEQVFDVPGIGEHFVKAVLAKDQFLILGVVLVYATMLVLFNLIVDLAYAWVDPRIEVQ